MDAKESLRVRSLVLTVVLAIVTTVPLQVVLRCRALGGCAVEILHHHLLLSHVPLRLPLGALRYERIVVVRRL
ncbi:MAG TPA: hypothetical protein VN764_14065 [Polyangiaceae bacterium]|nr:hypothetical protein [Polyangiaceae bacterium]